MAYFSVDQARLYERLHMLRDLLRDQPFQGSPCPLLKTQLTTAEVIGEKFLADVRKLNDLVKESERAKGQE